MIALYKERIPELLGQLDTNQLGTPGLRALLRKCLLSASPADQPSIGEFCLT
jgi:hypothetical protein